MYVRRHKNLHYIINTLCRKLIKTKKIIHSLILKQSVMFGLTSNSFYRSRKGVHRFDYYWPRLVFAHDQNMKLITMNWFCSNDLILFFCNTSNDLIHNATNIDKKELVMPY